MAFNSGLVKQRACGQPFRKVAGNGRSLCRIAQTESTGGQNTLREETQTVLLNRYGDGGGNYRKILNLY
ncbi:hypothetical protein [Parapedobacter sp. 2B3]|uniref:hypothetical protein n=1 Tax=Parapedobacter sp. 2B3 TaxID=3342381 RepID=UPI0035B5CE2D